MGQKKNIADAIPADFAKLLSGTGLLDAVQGGNGNSASTAAAATTAATAVKTATTTPTSAARPATAPTSTAGRPGMAGAAHHHHHFSWTPWLAAIAAASALWWTVFGDKLMQPHPTVAIPAVLPPSTTLATTPLPAVVANTEAGKLIVDVITDMKGAIAGVRDAATAQSSLGRIQEVAGRLEKVSGQVAQLNTEQRRALSTYVLTQQGLIKTAITNALALPGVSALLKPVLEQMLGRIEGMAKA